MTLPGSGNPISLDQVNIELGIASGTTRSLNDANVRSLAGIPNSGTTISMSDLLGKSNYIYSVAAGNLGEIGASYNVQYVISASRSVVWTWSRSPTGGSTGSPASGNSGTSLTVTQACSTGAGGSLTFTRSSTWNVSANDGGVITSWTFVLTAYGDDA